MFFLAEKLGMTVRRLGTELDSFEYSEWIAYHNLQAREQDEAMKRAKHEQPPEVVNPKLRDELRYVERNLKRR